MSPMHLIDEDEEQEIPGFDAEAFATRVLQSKQNLAAVIDHTLLQPDATQEQIIRLCREAADYRFACVLVNPVWTALAYSELAGTNIPVAAVVGFPLGASLGTIKREEAASLVKLGARQLDTVLNLGLLKSGENQAVEQDIAGVVDVAHDAGAIVKVILETSLLNVEEKLRGAELAIAAGADFLATSTGFATAGATVDDVALLRGVAGGRCGVKASGGIRSLADARRLLEAGANRLGTSASVGIIDEM